MTLRSPNSVLRFGLSVVLALSGIPTAWAAERPVAFEMDPNFLKPPADMSTIGDSHGDIAVSPAGEIYVSVEGGPRPGIQVYGADGHYLRNVPNAPNDLQGFIITTVGNAKGSIFGARLTGQQILHLGLDGRLLLTIPATHHVRRAPSQSLITSSRSQSWEGVSPSSDCMATCWDTSVPTRLSGKSRPTRSLRTSGNRACFTLPMGLPMPRTATCSSQSGTSGGAWFA